MKSYWGERELRLVGKAWEIRYLLRRLALRDHGPGTTVTELLMKRSPT